MKNTALLLFAMLMTSVNITAKNSPVAKWLMTRVEVEGVPQDVYSEVEFKDDGYVSMEGRVFGEWEQKGQHIIIESEMIEEFSGDRKISKLNKNEMILEGPQSTLFFMKLDEAKIIKDNTNSGLEGTWKSTMNEKSLTLIFELPKSVKIIETGEGMESKSSGEWIYNSADKSLLLMTSFHGLSGKVILDKLTEKEFVINTNGTIVKGIKLELPKVGIERLTFSENDFFTEEGNPKYNEDGKLPWMGQEYAMIQNLKEIESLSYTMSTLIGETETFETKMLKANISTQGRDDYIETDYIFLGFDRESAPEGYEMPTRNYDLEAYNYDKKLFPFSVSLYKVVSQNEKVIVPAGTFKSTVVEFIGENQELIKMWMLNENLGIIAKVIIESNDLFGDREYTVYELTSINK